jgi:8-oxo-dGTP pyrophosphatase MutT (NUDIX family)
VTSQRLPPFSIPEDVIGVLRRVLLPADHLEIEPGDLRQAAVMALVGEAPRAADHTLLLIERAPGLPSHGGQLAFPGGKVEPDDRDLLDTALREAAEEVGLEREGIDVLGRLHSVPTPTGFMIVPFVAKAPPGWEPRPHDGEVRTILQPTLGTLADPNVCRISGRADWKGRTYDLYEFSIHHPPLWGATARMVWELLVRMSYGPDPWPPSTMR